MSRVIGKGRPGPCACAISIVQFERDLAGVVRGLGYLCAPAPRQRKKADEQDDERIPPAGHAVACWPET